MTVRREIGGKVDKVAIIPVAVSAIYRRVASEETTAVLERYGISCPYILYVGSIEARKNLSRLLEAYSRLRAWSDRWVLVIVGATEWQSSPLFATVQRLKLEPRVQFTGFVAERDLPAIYSGADLFVFPSLCEGFGLPVLEAMACGTPVVTSTLSSLPEVAGDAGILVDPYDPNAIAVAMRSVLEDPGLASTLCANGLARAQQFTWERTARETIAVYEEVRGRL